MQYMSKTVDLGPVSTYAIAVAHGYTGTEEEWIKEQGEATEAAKAAARAAEEAAEAAKSSASGAAGAAEQAEAARNAAAGSASSAVGSATAAGQSATNAAGSASGAASAASAANTAAGAAEAAKKASESSASAASGSATAAQQAATEAGQSKTDAEEAAQQAAAAAEKAENAALRTYRRYIARWDKANAQLVRFGDAAGITTDTSKFCYKGSVSGDYSNPFDGIYPWSARQLCNIDLDAYRALEAGASLRNCVKAWDGEPGFSYDDPHGVWVYTPEFWGDAWEDGTYRWYEVADREVAGLIHYPESIGGRWHGAITSITVNGAQKTGLLPLPGMPGKRVAVRTLHEYARNGGFTLENIFTYDATSLLYLVEYGNFNSQLALGNGVSDLYREGEDHPTAATTDGNTITVQTAAAGNIIPGAILDIGTSKGGNQVGSFIVQNKAAASDSAQTVVTLDRTATVTTDHFWSIHGLTNTEDSQIGSRSGYIGTNGKSHAYYRGEVFHANLWRYILGVYHQKTTNRIFVAASEAEADNYDEINTAKHIDTGIEIAASGGYVKSLGFKRAPGLLAIPACTEIGGNSSNPVGDYFYNNPAADTILLAGGSADYGAGAGRFCGNFNSTSWDSYWFYAARPLLKTP